jgi:hypothetical protein
MLFLLPLFAGEGWGGGVAAQLMLEFAERFPPTRRALARNCAAERVDLPRKRETLEGKTHPFKNSPAL